MLKVIVTGPESSGKTTLCKALSNHLDTPYSTEYAREYLNQIDRVYTQKDLIKIAKEQLNLNQKYRLLDTDLITIKIWSNYKYGNCDNWILEQIEKQKSKNRFYLLCKPDLKWVKDPFRENPKNRIELFKLYKKELKDLHHDYYVVEGKNRNINAISKILVQKSFF